MDRIRKPVSLGSEDSASAFPPYLRYDGPEALAPQCLSQTA